MDLCANSINNCPKPSNGPCKCTKWKARSMSKSVMSITFTFPEINSLWTEWIETKPMQLACWMYDLILSVLPKCITTRSSLSEMCFSSNFLEITSKLPDPSSRRTTGICFKVSIVTSSCLDTGCEVLATATISSSRNGMLGVVNVALHQSQIYLFGKDS